MRLLIAFLLMCLLALPALAHDFWIEPTTFRPVPGKMFGVGLRVGQNFIGDPVPRGDSLIKSFTIREAALEHSINGSENQEPAGYARLFRPGVAVIGYQSKPYPLELSAEKFNEFLAQEGLDDIRAQRHRRGEDAKPDREQFSRFAKAVVGTGAGAKLNQPFGWRFEIVPETNPLEGTLLGVRVLLDQKPVRAALVTAINRDDEAARVHARTNADGRAVLALPKAGVWQIKCVALVPAAAKSGFEWESLWASLTFER